MWLLGHLHFCVRCGAYSGGRVGLLLQTCKGYPSTEHLKRAKTKLLLGVHPASGLYLGESLPILPGFTEVGTVSDTATALAAELG